MRRYKRAIRGVALFTQQGDLSSTNNARIFKALNTVNSGQLRILGSYGPTLPGVWNDYGSSCSRFLAAMAKVAAYHSNETVGGKI